MNILLQLIQIATFHRVSHVSRDYETESEKKTQDNPRASRVGELCQMLRSRPYDICW
jgi:hypothetical protein